jgi:hypothetical protein
MLPPPPPPPDHGALNERRHADEPAGDDLVAGLLRAVAVDRVRDAATARARTNWLVRQSSEGGTFGGVLADLAERAEPVVCTTRSGRRHIGRVHTIGVDFVALRGSSGTTVLVGLQAVAVVRQQPGAVAVTGDRAVRDGRRLVEVLTDLSNDRPDVVVASGDAEVRGELRAVGHDVVTLRVDGRPARAAYVALACTDEVRVG